MIDSTSLRDFSTVSSMRAGWIRPSTISFSSARRATSRLIGSKLETITASGVSSMIKSTPVRVSMVLMFRPSRPIIRPFISSLGRLTTETVVSATWSAATFWIAKETMFFAFFSAFSFASCSISLTIMAASCFVWFSTSFNKIVLASSAVRPEIFSIRAICCSLISAISFSLDSSDFSFWFKVCSFFSKLSVFLSKFSSFWLILRSWRLSSFLRSLTSASKSARSFWFSSLASSNSSRFLASAAFSASFTIDLAFSSALPNSASAIFFLCATPKLKPTMTLITHNTIATIIITINNTVLISNTPIKSLPMLNNGGLLKMTASYTTEYFINLYETDAGKVP